MREFSWADLRWSYIIIRAMIVQRGKQSDRARKVLTPESQGNIASRKERSLLAKSSRRRGKGPKR